MDEWIARYLAGECNEDEERRVREWIRRHPDMMDEYIRIWEQTPPAGFTPDVEQALQNVNHRIDVRKKSRSQRLYALAGSAAAIALLLITLIGIPHWNAPEAAPDQHLLALETGRGETIEYRLPDGSTIWLNHSSSLRYPESFSGDTREVHLEGEAFFDISPDPGKPFIIHAHNTITRVVGTSFGISAVKNAGEVVVTVATGIINLSTDGKPEHIELRPGEQGICHPKEQKLMKNVDPDPNVLAWKTKILVFKHTPLTEVAKVIENTYHTPVSVDETVAGLQLTSTFEQRSLEEVVQIIAMTLQIDTETNEKGILLTKK